MTQEVATTQDKANTVRKLLTAYRVEVAHALPKHVSPDRMLRMAMTSARKNPELLNCSPESFLGAVIQSAQLGLEPDTPLGHAYLIPFNNTRTGQKEVNFMPGYRGLMDLVYRTPGHPILMPTVVHEGDKFEFEKGLYPKLIHTPMPRTSPGKLIYAYCTAAFPDGRKEFECMPKTDIEAIRERSKATGFSPWKSDYDSMAKKTVIRQLVKYLPMSAELQTAIGLDDLCDADVSQQNDLILHEGKPVQTKSERISDKLKPGDFGYDSDEEHG